MSALAENMKTLSVVGLLELTTISKSNNDAWTKLASIVEKEDVPEVLLDFRRVTLIEPWKNEYFKQLLKMDKVFIKLYSSTEVANTIRTSLMLDNIKSVKVFNEDILMPHIVTPAEKTLIRKSNALKEKCVIVGDQVTLSAYTEYTTLGEFNTVLAMGEAFKQINAEKEIKNFYLDLGQIQIQENIYKKIAELIAELASKGLDITVYTANKEAEKNISIYRSLGQGLLMSDSDKLNLFMNNVKKDTVGMLSIYRDSKKRDIFGRKGDGEPMITRPAIFNGFNRSKGEVTLSFTSFNGKTFHTKKEHMLDYDGDELTGLKACNHNYNINDIGLADIFTGASAHFNMPIMINKSEMKKTYTLEEGSTALVEKTLPEFIKMVLDDHGITYNVQALDAAIVKTRNIINK